MKLLRVAVRCVNDGFHFRQFNRQMMLRNLSTNSNPFSALIGSMGNNPNNNANPSEPLDIFEKRIFSGPADPNNNANTSEPLDSFEKRIFSGLADDKANDFFRKIDNARSGPGMGSSMGGGGFGNFDDGSMSSLTDGMEERLRKEATYFEVDMEEVVSEEYTYRADMNFRHSGLTYTPEDLNIKKPGFHKPGKRPEFQVTTREALKQADFRNVRFLANFLTEAGIIVKRSKTGISAKAQKKIAREIKTARAFGLLPFTTMGTKSFVVGKTMEDNEHEFALDHESRVDDDDDPVAE